MNFPKTKAFLTVPPWFFYELSLSSRSCPSLSSPQASCCPEPHGYTAQDNPDKQHAAASGDLAESFCPTSVANPLRLNKAPGREKGKGSVCLCDCLMMTLRSVTLCHKCVQDIIRFVQFALVNFRVTLTIWHRERLWLTSFSRDRISTSSLPSKAFILSCLFANLKWKKVSGQVWVSYLL